MNTQKLNIRWLKKYSKYLGLFVAIAISVLVFIFRDRLVDLKSYGYLGIFLVSILGNATIILPIPVILTAFIGGGLFNPLWVGIITSLGAAIGELTGYLMGLGGRAIVADKNIKKIEGWMQKYGLWVIFVLAAIPNPLFDLAGIVAGTTKIPVWKYLLIVWLGKLVKFLLIAYLGAGTASWFKL
jgi:uncharacterized membrane protein YdjX (TVP38/TMEM64 family)